MKRVLIIPKESVGIIDVRQVKHLVLEQVQYLEQITQEMATNGMPIQDFKFCQFEADESIPIAFKISDKIGNGVLQEFTCDHVTFKDANLHDSNNLIEQRYLNPMHVERQQILQATLECLTIEKLGVEVKQSEYDDLKEKYDKIDKRIKDFRHVHYHKKMI